MKKKLSKTEYIKEFLLSGKGKRCNHCKYYTSNYKDIDETAKHFFRDKCKHCIERWTFGKRSAPDWVRDNFKPLYEWEPDKKE